MNQLIIETSPTPSGWLVSKCRDLCIFFINDQKLLMSCPSVMTQTRHCTEKGIPIKLKNKRQINNDVA